MYTQAEQIAFQEGLKAAKANNFVCLYSDPGLKKAWDAGVLAQLENERWF